MIRVVLADDHALVRAGLRMILATHHDIEVVGEASDGKIACELIAKTLPDVAVLDVTMPNLSGLEAASWIRDNCPNCRVVILSMHGESAFVREAFRVGVHGYLTKDTEFDELPRAIRVVHDGKHYVCPEAAQVFVDQLRKIPSEAGEAAAETGTPLTFRQQSVLKLLAEGLSAKEVAHELGISSKTVDAHRRVILKRLQLETTADLVRYAIRNGLVTHT